MSHVHPLQRAIFDGDCERIDALLAGRDPNVTTEDSDKWNLLHLALVGVSRPPRPEVVRHLIELGVDVNARDRRQWTPLHFAARTKNPAVVKLLIDAGADVNAMNDEGITPLHESLAEYPVNLKLTEIFLAAGAKTDILRKYVDVVVSPVKRELLDLLAKHESRGLLDEAERVSSPPRQDDQG
ncbi:Ankyrin repeat protein [Aquisphaera giovannonii]|uniref:Ankyrin repeat protein n=1 Tax=Aquisphaera giovannonii TaxID=406548 RepID=A0A5B9VYJ6_9BACT|nr:ankyrin repeat domain-containing protein [Aquisphaera giovannonii]QEH33067.1 Ankyrin repeat protein [Aquisphaera giovannonii]